MIRRVAIAAAQISAPAGYAIVILPAKAAGAVIGTALDTVTRDNGAPPDP